MGDLVGAPAIVLLDRGFNPVADLGAIHFREPFGHEDRARLDGDPATPLEGILCYE